MFETLGLIIDSAWAGFFAFNPLNLWSLCLYFVPLAICLFSWFLQTTGQLKEDKRSLDKFNRGESNYYDPTVTIGVILNRIFWSFVPIVNLGIAIFDRAEAIATWFKRTFDIPLIGKKAKRTAAESEAIRNKASTN